MLEVEIEVLMLHNVSVFKKENRLGAFSKYLLGTGEKTGIVTTMKKDKKRLGK